MQRDPSWSRQASSNAAQIAAPSVEPHECNDIHLSRRSFITASMLCWALASDHELSQLSSHHALWHIWRAHRFRWCTRGTQLQTQSGSAHLDSIASFMEPNGLCMGLILSKLAQCGNHNITSFQNTAKLQLASIMESWLYYIVITLVERINSCWTQCCWDFTASGTCAGSGVSSLYCRLCCKQTQWDYRC